MKRFIFFVIGILGNCFAYHYIDLNSYLQLLNSLSSVKIKNITLYNKLYSSLSNSKCFWFKDENFFYLKPTCLSQNFLPTPDRYQAIQEGFHYIQNFTNKYKLDKTAFIYTGAKIIWNSSYFSNYENFLQIFSSNTTGENLLNAVLFAKNYYIKIPKQYIYRTLLDKFSYFVSTKNLSNRGNCRKHNYLLAINSIDGYVLYPGQSLNFNKKLANINNNLYCKELGNKNKKFLFYEGVCGAASQLFRNSLLNPDIMIEKRYNHSKWYAKYYSPYIYGDDASLYEMIKQLQIKNIGKHPIYFKKLTISPNNILLVSILPYKTSDKVIIFKKQLGKLQAVSGKIVFDKNFEEKYSQIRISRYCCKTWE